MSNSRFLTSVFAFSLLCGCAPDEATPPTNDDDTDTGDGDGDGDGDTGDGDPGDGDGDSGDGDGDGDGDECIGPDGCFACEPTDSIELTNACTDATCDPFPNTPDRLPLLEPDGGLPPLP